MRPGAARRELHPFFLPFVVQIGLRNSEAGCRRLITTHLCGIHVPVAHLTEKQTSLLDYLRQRADQGEPPTYRELCVHFGWASTATARDHLRALSRKGHLELAGRKARRIRLVANGAPVARIPLIGEVVAGIPIAAEESVDGQLPIPAEWARRGSHFALRVHGDSMKDAGILPGDQVVVRAQSRAEDDDIVVATVDGETTLKRLSKRGRRTLLMAENSAYRAIAVKPDATVIHGVVVGLLRSYTASPVGRHKVCSGGVSRLLGRT
jgi:repressor LexA